MNTIKQLQTEVEWKEAFPVVKQLRTHLDEELYLTLVKDATAQNDYKLFALYEDGRIASVIGFIPMVTLYNERFIWVCDLVTDEGLRSCGYGNALLSFAETWAKDHGFGIISLSSGLQRKDAHRFYMDKMNYNQVSYVFLKNL